MLNFTIKLKRAILAMIGVIYTTTSWSQPYQGKLGVEAANDAFVDIVKQGYRWEKLNSNNVWEWISSSNDVDASGWPKSDTRFTIDFRPTAEWGGTIDDPEAYRVNRSGVYKGSFQGQAMLVWSEGPFTVTPAVYNVSTNTSTFDLTIGSPGPHHGLIRLIFQNTRRTPSDPVGSGITNFKLVRPGYPANTTQLFTNEYISTLTSARFSTIRFMDVMLINDNIEWGPNGAIHQLWSNRKKPIDAGQALIAPLNKKDGWCWEYAIALCNEVNMDMWINIPVAADDNYIQQLALLIKNGGNGFPVLEPGLKIYIEHTNELWNFGFDQYAWNKAKAVEEVGNGIGNYNYDGNTNQEIWNQRRHAKRVRDIVNIFGNVFGISEINNRIRGILAGNDPLPNAVPFFAGRLQSMLEYLNANYGAPKNYIYAISVAIYYGTGEAGSTGSVQQILNAMSARSDADVTRRVNTIALANTYQLPGGFCSYEGGPDVGEGIDGSVVNVGNRIMAMRHSSQKDLYKKNFADNFWDLGGNLAMQFRLQSSYSRYGAWGLTDDITNPDRNSLFEAARELVGGGGTQPPAPSSTYQAENFSVQVGCSVSSANGGSTGQYLDYGSNGSYGEWNNVYVDAPGSYTLTINYANGGGVNRPCAVSVNNNSAGNVVFAHTGSWSTWANVSIPVTLNTGNNVIRITANTSAGGPNVDYFEVKDTQAPAVPANLSFSNISLTGFTFSWQAPADNVATTGYEVFRNGTLLQAVTGTSLQVTGVCGTTYAMSVRARDAAGNWSSPSVALNVSTAPCSAIYQGEAFTAQSGGGIGNSNPGSTGGYLDYGANGSWGEWNNVVVSSNGPYTINVRYANGTSANRQCALSVNGQAAGNISFASTGSWSTWVIVPVNVTLQSGSNTIRITANTSNGGPNVDLFEVTAGSSSGRIAVSKEETSNDETNSVSIFPNPASSDVLNVVIYSDKKVNAEVNMFSPSTEKVVDLQHALEKGNNAIQIPIHHLNSGMYFLRIKKAHERVVKKVIIKK